VAHRHPGRACALAVVLASLLVAGCSSDDPSSNGVIVSTTAVPIAVGEAPVRVEWITAAIAAVEQSLGGPQRYFEINASPTVVNLFVALEDGTKAVSYVSIDGVLADPTEPIAASGPTFAASAVAFDPTRVLAATIAQLPTSTVRLFSITGIEDGDSAQYGVVVESSQGSSFRVFVNGNGDILGTDQRMEIPDSVPVVSGS